MKGFDTNNALFFIVGFLDLNGEMKLTSLKQEAYWDNKKQES